MKKKTLKKSKYTYQILFCQVTMPSYSAKLFCQQANMAGEWLKNKQKWKKNRKLWKKPTKRDRKKNKNDRKTGKMRSFTNYIICIICQAQIYVLTSSNFCPAKLPFLSCQAPISVLPRSHLFVLPSEAIFSRGGQGPPSPPSQLRLWVPMGAYQCLPVPHLCSKHLQVLSYSSLKGSFKILWTSIPISAILTRRWHQQTLLLKFVNIDVH